MATVVHEGDLSLREKAVSRLKKKQEFHRHLLAYVLVNGFLWLIWGIVLARGGTWFPWPVFPLFGWGIGLAFHAWDTYGGELSEQSVRREMEKLREVPR